MSERSDAIAAALRKAIERGEYGDGERLSQSRLALQHGAHRDVIGHALYLLEFEGFVSRDARHAYHANASYQTRQVQRVLTQLDQGSYRLPCNHRITPCDHPSAHAESDE